MSNVLREVNVKVNNRKTDIKGLLINQNGAISTFVKVADIGNLFNAKVTGHGSYININTSNKNNSNGNGNSNSKETVEEILGVELPKFEKKLLTNTSEFSSRKIKVKQVVIHSTGNRRIGANEDAHWNYFNNTKYFNNSRIYANYNFIVGNEKVLQMLKDDKEGWHAANREVNRSSVGISMCENEDYNFKLTMKYAAYWAAVQLKKYNLSTNELIRHYDVTKKHCPTMFYGGRFDKEWNEFKKLVERIMHAL